MRKKEKDPMRQAFHIGGIIVGMILGYMFFAYINPK